MSSPVKNTNSPRRALAPLDANKTTTTAATSTPGKHRNGLLKSALLRSPIKPFNLQTSPSRKRNLEDGETGSSTKRACTPEGKKELKLEKEDARMERDPPKEQEVSFLSDISRFLDPVSNLLAYSMSICVVCSSNASNLHHHTSTSFGG